MQKIIVKRAEPGEKEPSVELSAAQVGSVARYAEVPFDIALKENGFFIVCGPFTPKDGEKRIRICGFDGTVVERDIDRKVIVHECSVSIKLNEPKI